MTRVFPGSAFGVQPAAILLVEDDEGLTDLIRHHLEPAGLPMHAVRTGGEALAWLASHPDALMLLDYSLPDMTAAALLLELERGRAVIPFVIMTGHGDERIAVEMMKQGARDYLIKDLHFLDRLPGILDRVLRELRNERQLEASEQRFRAIFEGSQDALMLLDRDGFIDCNSRTLTLFGYDDKGAFLSRHPADVSPPEQPSGESSAAASRARIELAMRQGSTQFEWTHRRLNGEVFPAEVLLSSFELAGKVLLQATVRDITERRRDEQVLQESRERYRQLVQVSPDAIFVHADGAFIYANPAGCRLLGASEPSQLIGRQVLDHVHADHREAVVRRVRTAIEGGDPAPAREEKLLRMDGTAVDAEVVAASMRYNGQPAIQVIARDISERKRAQRQLAERERQMATLLSNLPGMAYRCRNDRDWTMEFVSEGCYELTGYGARALLFNKETSYNTLIHPADRDRVWDEVQAALESGLPFRLTYRLIAKDGQERWAWEIGRAVRRADGSLEALEGFITDITDRMRAQEAVQESEQRFRHIVGNATAAFFRADTAGRIEQVNEAWLQLHGYDQEEEVLGQPIDLMLTEENRPRFQMLVERLLLGQTVPPGESAHRRRDGSFGYHAYSLWPVQRGRKTTGFEGFLIDTTVLRKARADYQMLFEGMLDGFALHKLICDDHGKPVDYQFLAINPAFERLTGLKASEVAGKRLSEILPNEDRYWVNTYGKVVLTGAPISVEHASSELSRLFKVNAFRTGPMEFAAVFVDITEHRRAEEDLRRSQEEMLSIYEHSPVMMVLLDADGRVRRINQAMAEFASQNEQAAEGLRTGDLLGCPHHQDDPLGCSFGLFCQDCTLRKLVQTTHETGIVHRRVEFKPRLLTRREAREVVLLASTARIPSGGRPLVLLCLEDVTRQSQAEDRLREQAALLDITQDAILVLDLEGRVQFWSRGAERLYGWSRAEAVGQFADALLSHSSTPSLPTLRNDLLQLKDWTGELQQFHRDQSPLIVQCRASLVHDASGIPRSMMLVATNITEQKALEAKFLRAQRLESIGALASGVAHDLNNILSPLLMALPVLQSQLARQDEKDMVGMMVNGVRRGSGIIKQLLMFGRGAEGTRTRIKPESIVQEMIPIIHETFPKSIQLATCIAPDLPALVGDATQLHQVMLNLCVNARDAMLPDGGTLTLSASLTRIDEPLARMYKHLRPGPYLLLEVADTGSGIPPEIQERIFDPFFTTKEIGKGTGLGLSTVQGIARSHGGFVDVASQVGEGTTFRIYLPAVADLPPGPEGRTQTSDAKKGKQELILVIDDEDSLRNVISKLLVLNGYKVISAIDGAEGIRRFEQDRQEIRAVVIDMMMPNLDGAAAIRLMREQSPGVFIVGMSGLPQMEGELIEAARGSCAFLSKPFSMEELLVLLDTTLHEKHCGDGKDNLG